MDSAPGGQNSKALMGNIAYPIQWNELGINDNDLFKLYRADLQIKFDIGTLGISASREALEYKPTTISNLREAIYRIRDEILAAAKKKIEQAPTIWDARGAFCNLVGRPNSHYGWGYSWYRSETSYEFLHEMREHFRDWRGHRVDLYGDTPLAHTDEYVCGFASPQSNITGSATKERAKYSGQKLWYDSRTLLIVDNCSGSWVKRATVARAEHAQRLDVENNDLPIIVLRAKNNANLEQVVEDFCKAARVTGIPTTYLMDIPDSKLPVRKKTKNLALKQDVFLLNKQKLTEALGAPSERFFTQAMDVETEGGVYLELHRFFPKGFSYEDLNTQLEFMKSIGIDTDSLPIYGFRSKFVKKLGPNWTPWLEHYKEAVMPRLEALEVPKVLAWEIEVLSAEAPSRWLVENYDEHIGDLLPLDHPVMVFMRKTSIMQKALSQLRKQEYQAYRAGTWLYQQEQLTLPELRYSIIDERRKFKERYPMLEVFNYWRAHYSYYATPENLSTITNYLLERDQAYE